MSQRSQVCPEARSILAQWATPFSIERFCLLAVFSSFLLLAGASNSQAQNKKRLQATKSFRVAQLGTIGLGSSSTITAPLPPVRKPFWNDIQAGYFGWSYGPSFGNWNEGQSPSIQGSPGTSTGLFTQLLLTAPINEKFRFAAIPMFVAQPFDNQQKARWLNPSFGFQGVLWSANGFTHWARFEVVAPATEGAARDGLVIAPQTVQVLTYRGLESNWEFQNVVVPTHNFFKNGESSGSLYVSPMISYYLSRGFRFTLLSEHFFGRDRGLEMNQLRETQPDFVGLGFRQTWFLSNERTIFIHPYVNTFPDRLSADNVHFAMMFGGRLL